MIYHWHGLVVCSQTLNSAAWLIPSPLSPMSQYNAQDANIVVVTQQPVALPVVQPEAQSKKPIVGLVLSILMIFVCLLIGNILALTCLIPALVVASVVS